MNVLVFDIETIPDTEGGRRLYDLDGLDEKDIARAMSALRVSKTGGSDFQPHHLHRIVAISVVLRHADGLKVWSIGSPESPEEELISRFYDGIERYTPTLVSWNGGGFDLPVLHYRSMIHNLAAPRYWDVGHDDRDFRWNNYINRFHWRHIDLMDVLSMYQLRSAAPLTEMAVLCGFPGKLGMSGDKVWDAYCDGKIEDIRNYCETDVLNTYLLYLRWERLRGQLSETAANDEIQMVRSTLGKSDLTHLQAFFNAWPENPSTLD